MNLTDSIEHDFAVIDGTETIVFRRRGVTLSVAGAKGQPLRREAIEQFASSFGIDSTYRGFSLPVANLGGISPQPGDALTDAANKNWRVLHATLKTENTRWVVACIQSV